MIWTAESSLNFSAEFLHMLCQHFSTFAICVQHCLEYSDLDKNALSSLKFHDILGTLAEHDWIQRNFANSASSRTWVSLNGNASWFKLITHQQFDAVVEAPRGERGKKPWIVNGGSALPHVQRALPASNLAGECRSRLDVGGAASLRDHLRLRRHDDSPTRRASGLGEN